MSKSRLLRTVTASLFVVIGLAIAQSPEAAERELVLGMPTKTAVHAPGFAAMELGYFAEEGIKLKLVEFTTAVPVMEATLAKTVDIGGGGVFPLVIANGSGQPKMPLRFFYNHLRRYAFELMVPPSSAVKTIADLKGRKLGVLSLTTPYAAVTRSVLAKAGLAPNDVQIVPTGGERKGIEAMLAGQVDAHEIYMGTRAYLETDGVKLRQLPYDERIAGLENYSYYAREEMLSKEPEVIAGFGRALAKGVITCRIAREWCVKTFWKYFPSIKPTAENMEQEIARQIYVLKVHEQFMAFPSGDPEHFGSYTERSFKDMIDVLYEGGQIATIGDAKTLYTGAFVDKFNDFDVAAVEAKARTLK